MLYKKRERERKNIIPVKNLGKVKGCARKILRILLKKDSRTPIKCIAGVALKKIHGKSRYYVKLMVKQNGGIIAEFTRKYAQAS